MRPSAWLGLWGFVGCVAAATLAGGCSSSTPSDKYPAVGDYCKARATAECAQVYGACEIDKTTCETARTSVCLAEAQVATSAGRTYTPANAVTCVDATSAVYATTTIKDPTATLATLADTCARVFAGSLAKNAACSNPNPIDSDAVASATDASYQCSGTLVCDKGYCGDKSVVKAAGDGCANSGEVCDTGLYCSGTGHLVCTAKLAANQPCSATAPCLETLRCVAGVCAARLEVGATCATNGDCVTDFCDVYNPSGAKCGTQLTFSVGEPALCALFSDPTANVPVPDAGATSADAAAE